MLKQFSTFAVSVSPAFGTDRCGKRNSELRRYIISGDEMSFVVASPICVCEEPSVFRIWSWEVVPGNRLNYEISNLKYKKRFTFEENPRSSGVM